MFFRFNIFGENVKNVKILEFLQITLISFFFFRRDALKEQLMLPSQKKKRSDISFWKLHFVWKDDGLGVIWRGRRDKLEATTGL